MKEDLLHAMDIKLDYLARCLLIRDELINIDLLRKTIETLSDDIDLYIEILEKEREEKVNGTQN